jgi:hypothetical protein
VLVVFFDNRKQEETCKREGRFLEIYSVNRKVNDAIGNETASKASTTKSLILAQDERWRHA